MIFNKTSIILWRPSQTITQLPSKPFNNLPLAPSVHLDKPARLIIRLFFGFDSDIWQTQPIQSTNSETAMLSTHSTHPLSLNNINRSNIKSYTTLNVRISIWSGIFNEWMGSSIYTRNVPNIQKHPRLTFQLDAHAHAALFYWKKFL